MSDFAFDPYTTPALHASTFYSLPAKARFRVEVRDVAGPGEVHAIGITIDQPDFSMVFTGISLHLREAGDVEAFFDACSIAHRAWCDARAEDAGEILGGEDTP